MNYLAHLYMADFGCRELEDQSNRNGLLVGGFLADFVKGPLRGQYPGDIERGMHLHRKIDLWSDQHTAIARMKDQLPKDAGRYAGIVADLLCDHALVNAWDKYSPEPLETFAWQSTNLIKHNQLIFPEPAQKMLSRVNSVQWLTGYGDIAFVLSALDRISRRFTRSNPLADLEQPIRQNYQPLMECCTEIISDQREAVAKWCHTNTPHYQTKNAEPQRT